MVLKQTKLFIQFEIDVVGVLAASTGYIVLMPDFMGLSDGDWPHYYMHAESEVTPVVDMVCIATFYLSMDIAESAIVFIRYLKEEYDYGSASNVRSGLSEYSCNGVSTNGGLYDLFHTHRALMENDICHIHSLLICPTLYFRYN